MQGFLRLPDGSCGQRVGPYTDAVATTSEAPRRKDAQRNRETILAAARELFAESAEVPMCEVARRAGVGQATLYRNFPDRRSLASALLAEHMDRTEAVAVEHAGDPDALFVLLRNIVENMARFYSLGELARADACLGSELNRRRARLAELMRQPLRDAKAAGTLRCDLTVDDVFLVVRMVRGSMADADGPAARAAAGSRALALVLDGLTPARMR
jgi:AcrR family transcriptional regulator